AESSSQASEYSCSILLSVAGAGCSDTDESRRTECPLDGIGLRGRPRLRTTPFSVRSVSSTYSERSITTASHDRAPALIFRIRIGTEHRVLPCILAFIESCSG